MSHTPDPLRALLAQISLAVMLFITLFALLDLVRYGHYQPNVVDGLLFLMALDLLRGYRG